MAAQAVAAGVSVGSVSVSPPVPCPGDTVDLAVVIHNNETFTLNSGDPHLYVKLERQSTHGAGLCPLGFNQTPERDAWWSVDGATNPLVPQDPFKWHSSNPTWPNNGGYAVPNAMPAGSDLTVHFKVQLPPFGQEGVKYNTAYQFHVGSKAYTQGANDANDYRCAAFSTCSPPPGSSIAVKKADGTAANGDLMLYWVDYQFFNTQANWVSDVLPSCLTYAGASPQPFDGSPALWDPVTRRVTWRAADANTAANDYAAVGSLYIQVTLAGCSGQIQNTAQYCYNCSATGPYQPTNSVLQTVGQANVILTKRQQTLGGTPLADGALLPDGSQIQYVLEYTLSGDALRCFDSFDAAPLGDYSVGAGAQAPFGSWYGDAQGASSWRISDGGGGDHYLTYTGSGYHALYRDCPGSETAGQFCGGMVQSDLRHDQASDPNADALIILRSDGQPNGETYAVLLTGDENPGTPGSHLKVQRCSGGGCVWYNSGSVLPALDGMWYTVKAVEVPGQPGHILAKFWERGQPEPAAWMLNWTDPVAAFDCTPSAGKFRPGVGGQAAKDDYDNFRVYSANQLQNASLYDVIPAGTDYVSSSPLANHLPANDNSPGDRVEWDFVGNAYGALGGILYSGSGSFTWTATLDCSEFHDQVLNQGVLSGQILPLPALTAVSNIVHVQADCGTPTVTPSFTASPTRTPSPTATPTATPSDTPSRTPTASPSSTPTATPTASPTWTATPSATPSATPTATATASPTWTPTATDSATATATPTATLTATPTATRSATPTWTPTGTVTATFSDSPTPPSTPTITATPTATPSFSASPTVTASPSASATRSDTPTRSPSPSPSASPSRTPSPSPSATHSASATRSATHSPSPTPSATPSPSPTATATPSATPSRTPTGTPSVTPTFSASPSVTLTRTPAPSLPYNLRLSAYNSAGERVRVLFNGQAEILPASLQLDSASFASGDGEVSILLPGLLRSDDGTWIDGIAWRADNDNGQWVSGGDYVLKAEYTDNFGSVTTLQATVLVLPAEREAALSIYNSAGELVARPALPPLGGDRLVELSLSEAEFASGMGGGFTISVKDEAGRLYSVPWDGRNDRGEWVDSGVYMVKLVYHGPGGVTRVEIRSVTVLKAPSQGLTGARLAPNPAQREDWTLYAPPQPDQALEAMAFDLNGAKVAEARSAPGAARLRLPNQGLAGGIYLIVLQRIPARDSSDRRVFKAALLR